MICSEDDDGDEMSCHSSTLLLFMEPGPLSAASCST